MNMDNVVVNWDFVIAVKRSASVADKPRWQGLLNSLKMRTPLNQEGKPAIVFGSEEEAKASPLGQLLVKQKARPMPMFRTLAEHQKAHDEYAAKRVERDAVEQAKRDAAAKAKVEEIRLAAEERAEKEKIRREKREEEMSQLDAFGGSNDSSSSDSEERTLSAWDSFALGQARVRRVNQERFPGELVLEKLVLPLLNKSAFLAAGDDQVVVCAISGEKHSLKETYTYVRNKRENGEVVRDDERRPVRETVVKPIMQVVWLPAMNEAGNDIQKYGDGGYRKQPVIVTARVANYLLSIAKAAGKTKEAGDLLNFQPALKYYYTEIARQESGSRPQQSRSIGAPPRMGRPLSDRERHRSSKPRKLAADTDE